MYLRVRLICKRISIRHNSARQSNTSQDITPHDKFVGIKYFLVLYDFWWTKCYFDILDNLYVGQKVLWFGKGQKFQFLSCILPPICLVPKTVLQIEHWTTGVVLSCPSFFSRSNALLECSFVKSSRLDQQLLDLFFQNLFRILSHHNSLVTNCTITYWFIHESHYDLSTIFC
jgi:hypothetical protein